MSAQPLGHLGGCHICPQGSQKTPGGGPGLMESSVCSQRTWPTGADTWCQSLLSLKETLLRQSGVTVLQLCSCSGHVGLETQNGPHEVKSSPATPGDQSHRHCGGARAPLLGQPVQTPRGGQTATSPPHTPMAVQSLQTHPV